MAQTTKTGYTTWERLEPVSRNRELQATLRMALADPLWLLTRQKQFGELRATDGGAPVNFQVDYQHEGITRIKTGETIQAYNRRDDPPLETLIECEPAALGSGAQPSMQLRAETGMEYLFIVHDALLANQVSEDDLPAPADFPKAFWLQRPPVADAAGRRAYDVLGTDNTAQSTQPPRALDGIAVFKALQNAASVTVPLPPGTPADVLQTVQTQFNDLMRTIYFEPSGTKDDTWDASGLHYDMHIATHDSTSQTVFGVTRYRGGRLDWYDFDVSDRGTLDSETIDAPLIDIQNPAPVDTIPMRAQFHGMPAPRLWQFEDSQVNLSAVSAAGNELSHLLLLEFMLTAGNDWFIIPLEAPAGSLTRINDLTITDTFGVSQTALHTHQQPDRGDWSMYTFDTHPDVADIAPALLLPTLIGESTQSKPLETVVFTRDEIANLLFGIETVFEGPSGRPFDRTQFDRPRLKITRVHYTGNPNTDYIELENSGDDELSIHNWQVKLADTDTTLYTFGDVTLPPRSVIRLVPGGASALDTSQVYHASSTITLDNQGELLVIDAEGNVLLVYALMPPADSTLERYQLVTEVPDHWFPYALANGQFHPALLFDADAMLGTNDLPQPYGRIITGSNQAPINEAEITRAGLVVHRAYQLVSWYNGQSYLWSSRYVTTGHGERYSGLAFDLRQPPAAPDDE